jgi:GntR family transcriptional regulator, rspAB operon transcriptional repressor
MNVTLPNQHASPAVAKPVAKQKQGRVPLAGRMERQRISKANRVYDDIKEAILSGSLAPGAAIDKIALCERLGVSRFPVTTAINRLAYERLVLIEPQHGSFIAKISADDVRDLMTIRRALEVEIAGEAAHRLPEASLAALERNLRYQAVAEQAKDFAGFYALDVEFHHIIISGVALAHANEILESLRAHLERVRRLLLTPPGRLPDALKEHRAVGDAIRSGDAKAARAAMRHHLEQTSALLMTVSKQRPDIFQTQ